MKILLCRLGIPILVLAAFGSVAFWNSTALACRCAQSNPTAQQVLDGAKVVFAGVAKATTPVGPHNALTKFMVVESFKGATAGKELIVRHRSGPTPSCGVSFDTEKTHLVVARAIDESPGLATSYCSVWMFQGSDAVRTKLMKEMRAIGQR